jgi:hypothetical protein
MTIRLTADNVILPAGNLGSVFSTNRNVIHNGDFRVNQRAVTFPQAYTTPGRMNLDRWYSSWNYGDGYINQLTTSAFPGYFYRFTSNMTASPTAGSFVWMAAQQLEGNDVSRMNFGASNPAPINTMVLSFWVRSSIAGNWPVLIGVKSTSNIWHYAWLTYSTTVANKWQYKSLIFSIDSQFSQCPSINIDNNFSFGIWFAGGTGTNYHTLPGAGTFSTTVSAGGSTFANIMSNGSTWDIARVQLEPGTHPTPFEFVPIAQELRRCMRYYQKSYAYGTTVGSTTFDGAYGYTWTSQRGSAATTFSFWYTIPFQTRMRVAPTVTVFAPNTGTSARFSIDKGSYFDGVATFNQISDSSFQVLGPNPIIVDEYGNIEQMYGAYIHYRAVCDAGND